MTVFSGDIENDGTLATALNGVLLEDIKTFVGDINNKGTISAGSGGIAIGGSQIDGTLPVATFAGSVVNVGTIVAETGFSILDSTILGALVDSGTIRAASAGIEVNSAAVIVGGIQVSSKGTIIAHAITSGTGVATGIVVQNTTTFGGGITNSGTISARAASLSWLSVSTFAGGITNSGVITGGESIVLSQLSSFAGGSGSGGAIVNSGKITGTFDWNSPRFSWIPLPVESATARAAQSLRNPVTALSWAPRQAARAAFGIELLRRHYQ